MWSVQVNVLHINCKQNITSLSLLVGTTVYHLFSQCIMKTFYAVSSKYEFYPAHKCNKMPIIIVSISTFISMIHTISEKSSIFSILVYMIS